MTNLIQKLYGKKLEIKLVELKSIHLNSDVFSSAVALKLRDRKNKAVRILRKAILHKVRCIFICRYAGSLKNGRSSFNNKASSLLRGYVKSNGQYTIINSKTRNGTFGLKGWVSSH